jgi:GTP cyclohydrolase II
MNIIKRLIIIMFTIETGLMVLDKYGTPTLVAGMFGVMLWLKQKTLDKTVDKQETAANRREERYQEIISTHLKKHGESSVELLTSLNRHITVMERSIEQTHRDHEEMEKSLTVLNTAINNKLSIAK